MARTIAQIQASIIAAKEADPNLAALTSTSRVAIWRLWTWIIAAGIWVHESLFDAHKAEVMAIIAADKPHTLAWYVNKALAFQKGIALPDGSDVYAVVPPVDPTVQIVAYAAAVEFDTYIRMKLAKVVADDLAPLTDAELGEFGVYMNRVKDAGVRFDYTSDTADDLRTHLVIYYDPLVLDSTGARIDGTSPTPVKDFIKQWLKVQPFNGLFVLNNMLEAITNGVEGVLICRDFLTQARYAATPFTTVTHEYLPDSGYLRLDELDFTTYNSYVPHEPI